MIRRRSVPDGLPFRVYERRGKLRYSIGYKLRSGRWAFRYDCAIDDLAEIRRLRRQAIEDSSKVIEDRPTGGFTGLVDAWFEWQDSLPETDLRKRADSTIAENRREAENLKRAWGHFEVHELTRTMGYAYLDACVDSRPEKANKEIALARLILEYGIRKGLIETNPFDQLTKNKTERTRRYVTHDELDIVVATGRVLGGPYLIIALALRTAWLCVRRSVEVRRITRDAIQDAGIVWTDSKNPDKPSVLIEWSPELRETIREVLAIKRNKISGTFLLFGNMQGQAYTKSGWGKLLGTLMASAELLGNALEIEFQAFSLQDCRPKGVSDKLGRGDSDTQDATLHTDGKMIARVYDRRQSKTAKPAG
ncbi:hypothetical protein [uncultured Xylophilus sp.]|uniref:hypothetical protein n=1 Tax=uncultured Xylophilus sp. TaxID=296832 RepID=UPI0025E11240|nr:hypothetical protein [uncultured Xylophilus sp.]